jgi:preprotein translocase subunit YajC
VIYAQAAKESGSPYGTLIILLPMLLLFYFVGIRPGRKRMQQMQQVQTGLAPGREVVTTAGLYGTVTDVDATSGDVTLEIAPGVRARFDRRAVMKIVDPLPEAIPADGDETT